MHTINARGHKGSHCLIFSKGVAEPCDEEELFTIAMLAVLEIYYYYYTLCITTRANNKQQERKKERETSTRKILKREKEKKGNFKENL